MTRKRRTFRIIREELEARGQDTSEMTARECESARASGLGFICCGPAWPVRTVCEALRRVALGGTVMAAPQHRETFE